MKVTALAGGTGGAKLLVGLQRAEADLTAIINTGDDDVIYGVHVSPDVDMCTYWLAGLADLERGWGLRGDTFNLLEGLRSLGEEVWFSLGDRDLATCLTRTNLMRSGASLTAATDEIRRVLGVPTRILPMSDEPVRTKIFTRDGRKLDFQEYFVRERHAPEVDRVELDGLVEAKPGPDVIAAITSADRVIVTPSNPVVSIGPILALPGVREALVSHRSVIAVTPLIEGRPLKGPADHLLAANGIEVSAAGVAGLYSDFVDLFVVDQSDEAEVTRVQDLGVAAIALDTFMTDHDASERLARALL